MGPLRILTIISLSTIVTAGLAAGIAAPKTMAADLTSEQRALVEAQGCKPLKVFLPAAGFKPLTASAAQLRSAGYPPRPPQSDKAALQAWTSAVNRPLHFSVPHPVCTATRHSVIVSPVWAGHEVPESDYGSPIYYTTSTWVQPEVAGNSNYTNYTSAPDASFWTGTGIEDIIQAGCDSISTATAQYRCWTEDFPGNTDWEGPVVRPGQTVYVVDDYLGGNEAYYYIENETTDAVQSFDNAAPYVGLGSADYINEWLGPYLPDFGSVPVSDNYFALENGEGYYMGENNIYQMQDADGIIMSSPSFLSGDYGDFNQIFYESS